MTRTVTINRSLAEFAGDERQAWQLWLDQHGLDPMRIPLGSTIECDDTRRTVTATYLDADLTCEDFKPVYDRDQRTWLTHAITRQLESAPQPFPSGQTRDERP